MPKKKPRKKSLAEIRAEKSLELCAAVKAGKSFEEIKALVDAGGDLNVQDAETGEGLLHLIAQSPKPCIRLKSDSHHGDYYAERLVRFFIENGINLNQQDRDGRTALHFLVQSSLHHFAMTKFGLSKTCSDFDTRRLLVDLLRTTHEKHKAIPRAPIVYRC